MRSWAKAYGGLTVVAGIAYIIAILLGLIDGKLAADATFQDYLAYKNFPYVAAIAGVLLVLAGVFAVKDGFDTKRGAVTIYGFVSILLGFVIADLSDVASGYSNWNDALVFLNVIFVAFGVAAVAKDSLNGYFLSAIIIAIVTLVLDLAFVLSFKYCSSVYFGYLVGVLIIVTGLFCARSDRRYHAIVAAVAAREKAAKDKADEEAAKKAAEFDAAEQEAARKYDEERAAKAAATEEAAKKVAEGSAPAAAATAAAAPKVADEAAKKAAEQEAAKKAAEQEAAKKAADEAAKKAAAEEAAKKAAELAAAAAAATAAAASTVVESPFDIVCKACDKRNLAYSLNYGEAKIPMAYPSVKLAVRVFSGEPGSAADLVKDGWKVICFDAAEVTDGEKEAEVIADYVSELEVAAVAATRSAAYDTVCKACDARGLAYARDAATCKLSFKTEMLAVRVFSGEPGSAADLVKDGWKVICFDAAEVTDGEKETEVILDYLAELQPDEDEAAPVEEAAVPETVVIEKEFTNEDLGIEPVTVETPVRRATYNRGLRFRRKYGPHKIPVAFVACKVAIYVTDGVPDDKNDDELKANGWTILRFDGADVTDGEKEADAIEAAVKDAIRAQKAAAAKARKAKARKLSKKD